MLAARAVWVAGTAHLGLGALAAGSGTLEEQTGTIGLVDLLVPLQRIPSTELLGAGRALVLLVGGVDAFMSSIAGERFVSAILRLEALNTDRPTSDARSGWAGCQHGVVAVVSGEHTRPKCLLQ